MTQSMSRRSVLSGLGLATGAVALGAAMPAGAAPTRVSRDGQLSLRNAPVAAGLASAFFTPTPGLAYDVIDATSFVGGDGTRAIVPNGVSLPSGSGTSLFAPVNLSLGTKLREIRILYDAPHTPPAPIAQVLAMAPKGAINPVAFSGPLPTTTLDGYLFSFDLTIDGSVSYMVQFGVLAPGHVVQGMRIGYQPVRTGFVANSPVPRVLDTRLSGGKLQDREERVVSTGVPAGATAAVINLTITQTEQAGYVAAFPANATWPGNSSINWSSNDQNLANSVISGIDESGKIRIRGGVNPTQVIVDVEGYFI